MGLRPERNQRGFQFSRDRVDGLPFLLPGEMERDRILPIEGTEPQLIGRHRAYFRQVQQRIHPACHGTNDGNRIRKLRSRDHVLALNLFGRKRRQVPRRVREAIGPGAWNTERVQEREGIFICRSNRGGRARLQPEL